MGELHINDFGRVFQGHDKSCGVFREGYFDISFKDYRKLNGMNMREILDLNKLRTSGFDENKMKLLNLEEDIVDILENCDPLAELPLEIYSNLPRISSMEIMTPAGRQSLHVHTKDRQNFGIIQFLKPKRDRFWYDRDTLRDYLFDRLLDYDIFPLGDNKLLNKIKRIIARVNYKRNNKLWNQLMKNTDSINKIRL